MPEKLRITKTFHFDMAHALKDYDGPCRNIHGHTYHLSITLIGSVLENDNHPKNGMVADFGIIKSIVQKTILDQYDHALVLHYRAVNDQQKSLLETLTEKIVYLEKQPTCENLLLHFKNLLQPLFLQYEWTLFAVKLHETETSYAEWYASDNIA